MWAEWDRCSVNDFHCKMSHGGKIGPTLLGWRLQGRGAHAGDIGCRAGEKEVGVPMLNAGSTG